MSTAARMAVDHETASEDIRNAQQMLAGVDSADAADRRNGIEAVSRRLSAALLKVESMGRDVLAAAQEFSKARDEETLSLMNDLRAAHAQVNAMEYMRTTIRVLWQGTDVERFIVETIHRRIEGRFTRSEWHSAVALRDRLRSDAIIAAVKAAPSTELQRLQLVGRGD